MANMTNVRVLVVDDESAVADGVRAYLEDEDMQVATVTSAEDACELVRSRADFHVCIMDMRLSGMDGNAAIRSLANYAPQMRFLIHTGSADYVLPDDLRALGVTPAELFFKPQNDLGVLAAAVRRAATSAQESIMPRGTLTHE